MHIHRPTSQPLAPSCPDLDVGVIYTHEDQFMPALLSTLADSAAGLNLRLLLVDNVSQSGAAKWRSHVPSTEVISNDRRLGYAENLNKILSASTARYVLLMNTDMHFDPAEACLTKMVAFMDAHPRCGLSTCRLYHPDGTYGFPARRLQTLRTILARRAGMQRIFAGSLRDYLYLDRDHQSSFDCDWVSGCFMLLRREAFSDVGLFDTRFRKYFEDVDMCRRIWQANWSVMFCGATYAYHHEQRSSVKLFSRDAWLHLRSYLHWNWKWGLAQRMSRPQPVDAPEPRRRAA